MFNFYTKTVLPQYLTFVFGATCNLSQIYGMVIICMKIYFVLNLMVFFWGKLNLPQTLVCNFLNY